MRWLLMLNGAVLVDKSLALIEAEDEWVCWKRLKTFGYIPDTYAAGPPA